MIRKISKDQLAEVHAGVKGVCGCACTCYCGCSEETMASLDANTTLSSISSALSGDKIGRNNPVD